MLPGASLPTVPAIARPGAPTKLCKLCPNTREARIWGPAAAARLRPVETARQPGKLQLHALPGTKPRPGPSPVPGLWAAPELRAAAQASPGAAHLRTEAAQLHLPRPLAASPGHVRGGPAAGGELPDQTAGVPAAGHLPCQAQLQGGRL